MNPLLSVAIRTKPEEVRGGREFEGDVDDKLNLSP